MSSAKILILSQSPICRNPRVLKEAIALGLSGYQVFILNVVISSELYQQDLELIKTHTHISIQPVVDLTKKSLTSYIDRLAFKAGSVLTEYFGIESPFALGYGPFRYLRHAKRMGAGLIICHQEVATWAGTKLLDMGQKVAFDLEDWYSADLLPDARKKRPIRLLEHAEGTALKRGLYCTTTSRSLAKRLAEVHSCPQPQVIYNVFTVAEGGMSDKSDPKHPLKLFWFSQTVGPGRGIERIMNWLMAFNSSHELHLLGQISQRYKEELLSLMPAHHRLFFHALVNEKDLAQRISNFDIGLALELSEPESRNYTITNKFFQYLEAGLPVIATETAGQKEIFEEFTPGIMLPQNPSAGDIQALENWLNDPAKLAKAKQEAKRCILAYSWENESVKLLQLIEKAYGQKS